MEITAKKIESKNPTEIEMDHNFFLGGVIGILIVAGVGYLFS